MNPADDYDFGWEDANDHGHLLAENWVLDAAASGAHGPYSYRRPSLATEYYGKNEPEDPYYA
jgi:hypothetical protein